MYAKTIITVLTVLAIAVPAGACNAGPETCNDKYTHTTVPVPGAPVPADGYIVEDSSGWMLLYMESNGVADLQRGGTDASGNPDPCQASQNPDQFVAYIF